jgi:hypothetical protein
MGTLSGIDAAMDALAGAHESRASLCEPFVDVLPVTGAAISLLSRDFGTETICASDRLAARLDELQFDLGIGPCWDAVARNRPIFEPNMRAIDGSTWPPFLAAIQDEEIGALFAFPLVIGALDVGAVDLYSSAPGALSTIDIRNATSLATVAARQVLRRAIAADPGGRASDEDGSEGYGSSRREIHQATGMVLAQLDISAEDALLVLRGRAYSEGHTLREIANDVVERRLSFGARSDWI